MCVPLEPTGHRMAESQGLAKRTYTGMNTRLAAMTIAPGRMPTERRGPASGRIIAPDDEPGARTQETHRPGTAA